MAYKEKLVCLFDQLSESEQKAAYEFVQSLAHRSGGKSKNEDILNLFGKHYYVVSD